MLKPPRPGTLRVLVALNLALLALLLVFGLAFDPARAAGKGSSAAGTFSVLEQSGAASFVHMGLGILVGLVSLVNMVLCLRSGVKRVQVFGSLAFLAILAAGMLGLFFVFSGFRNTGLIIGLVPLFILSVAANFIELFYLRSPAGTRSG